MQKVNWLNVYSLTANRVVDVSRPAPLFLAHYYPNDGQTISSHFIHGFLLFSKV